MNPFFDPMALSANPEPIPPSDSRLIQIIDSALATAAQRSGPWLACKPGCSQCCTGVFAINRLDVVRLQNGLAELERTGPEKAQKIRERVSISLERLVEDFPGDPATGLLSEEDEASERFESYGNDEVCPVLDPFTQTCDLYESRPMTCRVFGPPVRSQEGLGVCELCYHGASEEEIASCEMVPDPDDLESSLNAQVEEQTGICGNTIVAFALR